MKIGQLTFHASHNYGSVLQAYALSSVLRSFGNEVQILNLRTKAQREAYRVFQVKGSGLKKLAHLLYTLYVTPARRRRFLNFEKFIRECLPISSETYSNGKELAGINFFDTFVTGSDQVWNPVCQDFDPAYYLNFADRKAKRVAYAPSLGRTAFDTDQLALIRELLTNVEWISCREESGAEVLRTLTDRPVTVVCDPVLLPGQDFWSKFAVPPHDRSPYILTYFLENNNGDKRHLQDIQRQTGYRVVSLNEDIRDWTKGYQTAFDATPQEFVGLIQNASFVLTNSFHATAFSTIFKRPFYTLCGRGAQDGNPNDCRKIDYLKRIGLSDRILLPNQALPSRNEWEQLDYVRASVAMDEFQTFSRNYLLQALS